MVDTEDPEAFHACDRRTATPARRAARAAHAMSFVPVAVRFRAVRLVDLWCRIRRVALAARDLRARAGTGDRVSVPHRARHRTSLSPARHACQSPARPAIHFAIVSSVQRLDGVAQCAPPRVHQPTWRRLYLDGAAEGGI